MRLITLVARCPLTYHGRSVGAGDVFETTPIDAAVLTYQRKAGFAPKGVTASPVPVPDCACADPALSEPASKPKRRYRRKDMTADSD
jgi:hypothetical protein